MDWKSLMIFLTMQRMASNLFRKKSGTHSNGQGCIYKDRKKCYFMMRVNIPSGIITNAQAEVLASIAEDYGRDVIDITTRQAIQFHWLEIHQIPDILKG